MTEQKRNLYQSECSVCKAHIGHWILLHIDGKPLCDKCERGYFATRRNESVSLAALEIAQGVELPNANPSAQGLTDLGW